MYRLVREGAYVATKFRNYSIVAGDQPTVYLKENGAAEIGILWLGILTIASF